MKTIKRFNIDNEYSHIDKSSLMVESENGDYVLYKDAIELSNKNAMELTELNRTLGEKNKELQDDYYKLEAKYKDLRSSRCEGMEGSCPNYRPFNDE